MKRRREAENAKWKELTELYLENEEKWKTAPQALNEWTR